MINLTKIVKEGLQLRDQPDSTQGAVQDGDVVLTQVKMKVDDITWSDTSPSDTPSHPRKVNIMKSNTASSEAFGQVQTVQEDKHFVRVELDTGIVKGVNRPLKLPLNNEELIKAFGPYVEINPSKVVSEPVLNKMKIGVAVEGDLGAQGATAQVTNKKKEYKGHFKATVNMYGKGLACGRQREVSEIIQDMKSPVRSRNPDLGSLSVVVRGGKKVVQFTMEGDIECRWDSEHTMEWK